MKRSSLMRGLAVGAVLAAGVAAGTCARAAPAPSNAAAGSALEGDPARGKILYHGCESCHSIDDNDIGPRHRRVVGRRAGSLADYNYSAALKQSGLTWDEPTLNRWLTNPSALVPGTKMFFKIDDPQMRADLIAYLKEQK